MNDHSSLVLQHFGILREGQEEAAKLLVAQFINSGILSNSRPKMVESQSFNPTTSAFISNTTLFDCCTPSHSSAASSFSASSSPSSPMRSSTPSSSDREYSSPADHQIRCRWGHCCRLFGSSEPFLEHVRLDHLVQLHLSNGQRQFTCLWKDCERGERPFSAIYMLVQHLRAHTGEKPYKCEWINCEKRYSRLENLKTHQRKHTGERPYQCSLCDRSFTNASDKAKHVNRVHKEKVGVWGGTGRCVGCHRLVPAIKQYLCTVAGCDSAYTDPSSLRKHTLASHGTSPWLEYKARRRNVRRIQNDRTEGGQSDAI